MDPASSSPPDSSAADPTVLVIASGNAGKLREFAALLGDGRLGLPLEVRPQPQGLEVEETGTTFAENARLKAEAVARATGRWALADDSGLSVPALGGAPGVFSARYGATDAARIERLLRELAEVSAPGSASPDRRARFTAALAVADPGGSTVLEVEGVCEGEILEAPRGSGGFGYDPVFLVPELGLSFAEMDPEQKRRCGHRGRALAALLPRLAAVLRPVLPGLVLTLLLPLWAALPAAAAPLPRTVGACSRTSVKEVLYRLSSLDDNGVYIPIPGSGSAITYTNGGYQVSYDMVPAIHRSQEGDGVELCLEFIPDCRQAPPGDVRGRIYRARNLRTGDTWSLPDSQHSCGGA